MTQVYFYFLCAKHDFFSNVAEINIGIALYIYIYLRYFKQFILQFEHNSHYVSVLLNLYKDFRKTTKNALCKPVVR